MLIHFNGGDFRHEFSKLLLHVSYYFCVILNLIKAGGELC